MSHPFEAAFAGPEADYRNRVLHATWGHLAPELRREYKGYMIFTHGIHGDLVVIDWEFEDLSGSPWFYQQLHDFVYEKAKEPGAVYRFDGTYMLYNNGNCRFSGTVSQLRLDIPVSKGGFSHASSAR